MREEFINPSSDNEGMLLILKEQEGEADAEWTKMLDSKDARLHIHWAKYF